MRTAYRPDADPTLYVVSHEVFMRAPWTPTRVVRFTIFALILGAQAAGAAPIAIEHSADPGTVIVSYRSIPGELAGPGASLRVYGDGRAVTQYPAPYARAGTWEQRLSASELDGLLQSLTAKGILDFDGDAVRAGQQRDAAARRAAGGPVTLSVSSDPDVIEIEMRLTRVQAEGAAERRDVVKTIRWQGLAHDRREGRSIAALEGLAAAVAELETLMARTGTRVD
jgi:hypothetical protein